MKITNEEFEELQNEWYEKLRRTGFVDIEIKKGDVEFLKQNSKNRFDGMHPLTREVREIRFTLLRHKVEDENTVYKNKIDKFIMTLHAEGLTQATIIRELRKIGIRRCEKTIFNIIRKYEIKWMIRSSTKKSRILTQ